MLSAVAENNKYLLNNEYLERLSKMQQLSPGKLDERAVLRFECAEYLRNSEHPELAISMYFLSIIDSESVASQNNVKPHVIEKIGKNIQSTLLALIDLDNRNPSFLENIEDHEKLKKTKHALAALTFNTQIRKFAPIVAGADAVNASNYDKLKQKMASVAVALSRKEGAGVGSGLNGKMLEVKPTEKDGIPSPEPEAKPQPLKILPMKDDVTPMALKSSASNVEESAVAADAPVALPVEEKSVPSVASLPTQPEVRVVMLHRHSFFQLSPPVVTALVSVVGYSLYTTGLAAPLLVAAVGWLGGATAEKLSECCTKKPAKSL